MSLAATLAASGMRPASFLPTIKCSSCGDEIEISAMGHHQCSGVPSSPTTSTAPSTLNNPFTLRQMNASETKPAQPSPLQFTSDQQSGRPRAPSGGYAQTSSLKPPRPALAKIDSAAANQPFLGPTTKAPISPASSPHSGSSADGKRAPKPRSNTNPAPRIFDPRPPSPELTANMDCAFPPFPTTPVTSSRKASTASKSSRKSSKKESHSHGRKSSADGNADRAGSRRSGATDASSRRSSKDDKPAQEAKSADRRRSQPTETLTPVEEHPAPVSPWLPPLSAASSGQTDFPISPMTPASESSEQAAPGRKPSDERAAPNGLRSIGGTIRSALGRMPSKKLSVRNRPANSEESLSPMPDSGPSTLEHKPSQRKVPPPRPARPDEGLPEDLLHPFSSRNVSTKAPSPPPPFPLQDSDRSKTLPVPLRLTDEPSSPTKLSKMTSEPALQVKADLTNSAQPEPFLPHDSCTNESRMDHRMQDAPPVPRAVQLQRPDSLHKSSDSGGSTGSSVSLGNLSLGNSNTTSGTSPVVSVANSIDVFRQSTYGTERNSGDGGLRVAALNVKPVQKLEIRAEPPKGDAAPQIVEVPRAVEAAQSDDETPTPPFATQPVNRSWPLESPTDPALHHVKLDQEGHSRSPSPSAALEIQATSEPRKLDRPSSEVCDPEQPVSFKRSSEQRPPNRHRPKPSASSDFLGFNFGMSNDLPIEESDRTPSPLEDSSLTTQLPPLPEDSDASAEAQTQSADPALPTPEEPDKNLRQPSVRRKSAANKAICRGCCKPIEGKSVKAADGRLTGRWHKACFVCQTCRLPFETADFYVINNEPYCEQHYHEKNGSICHGCHRGIEGEFLEAISGPGGAIVQKYHRRCFTCVDCRIVLTEAYFEVAGRVHCERHAFAAMRSQAMRFPPHGPGFPGSRLRAEGFRPEMRRTKLSHK